MRYRLEELIDIPGLQRLMDLFHTATSIPVGIIDTNGTILVATGWRDICTRFHRIHPVTAARCRESDDYIKSHLHNGSHVQYKCRNGLWDLAIPIVIAGEHIATLFLGQFFYDDESVDHEFFRRYAVECGFDPDNYLAALSQVPVMGRKTVADIMAYYANFVDFLADMGLARLKQQEAEGALRRSEERFRTLFENSSDLIAIISPEGTIRYLSPSIGQLLGYHPEETAGMNIFALVHPDDIPLATTEFSALHAEPAGTRRVVTRLQAADGTWRVCETVGRNLIHDPAIGGFLFNVRDITDRKRAEDEIAALNSRLTSRAEELEAANRDLAAFGYSLSHDLRTPLTRIFICAQELKNGYAKKLDESGRLFVDHICEASENMEGLISAMLDLSRLARRELNYAEIDLGELVRIITLELQIAEPERRVEFLLEPTLPVQGDPLLLKVALENLIGNAWKYTARVSAPRIEFGTINCNGETIYLVRDNGAGFAMEDVGRIFHPFQRLHRDDEFSGSGIGLATVQRIILRHGGRIWAEGAPAKGATFYFTLS